MIDEEKQADNAQSSTVSTSEQPTAEAVAPGTGESDAVVSPAESEAESSQGAQPVAADGDDSLPIDYQAALAAAESEMQSLKAQLEERTTQYMRIAADFDNYRKRTQREREELEQQVKCSTINELLPVVDNFERARSQFKPQTDAETVIHKGYQGVYKQLVDCLKRIGVAPMRAQGMEFDPNLHEAVMRQPTAEFPEGTVMEELQRGYMLGERVLRHALVKVAAAPEVEEAATAENQVTQEG
jgi:molecular chaperone GrpE